MEALTQSNVLIPDSHNLFCGSTSWPFGLIYQDKIREKYKKRNEQILFLNNMAERATGLDGTTKEEEEDVHFNGAWFH